MSVLKSSLNSVQNNRSTKIKDKNVSKFSERKCDSLRMATKCALNSVTKKAIHRMMNSSPAGIGHIYDNFME